MNTKIVILATETNSKMGSSLNKFLHPILGKTIIRHSVELANNAGIAFKDITVVISSSSNEIQAEINHYYPEIAFVIQEEQHIIDNIKTMENTLVLYGDMPLLSVGFLESLIESIKVSNSSIIVERKYLKLGILGHSEIFTRINTQDILAEAVRRMQTIINNKHMTNGVRIISPASVYIDATVEIEPDVVIYPGAILEGNCKIEQGAIVGPNTHMKNTVLKKQATIRQSVAEDAVIGENTEVGPFAYLRPGAVIGSHCRIGDFVEIKNANLGNDTKVAHLAYIGDADVGNGVNFGCGAITANYDGKNKSRTTIEDDAFIGSNVNLVAPVTIGKGAFAAAGSTITNDLQTDTLGIARARQVEKTNWKRPSK